MRRKTAKVWLAAGLVLAVSGCARLDREEMETLVDQARQEDLKDQALRQEENNYQSIHRAIQSGQIEKGMTQDEISSRHGTPVVKIPRPNGGVKWLYKPSSSGWFNAPRVAIHFDKSGRVHSWRCVGEEFTKSVTGVE